MTWKINETVRAGNVTARVKNYYANTDLLVLYDIKGVIQAGTTVIGDTSGTIKTFANFTISDEYDLGYEPDGIFSDTYFLVNDNNEYIVTDDYYINGETNIQDYAIVAV